MRRRLAFGIMPDLQGRDLRLSDCVCHRRQTDEPVGKVGRFHLFAAGTGLARLFGHDFVSFRICGIQEGRGKAFSDSAGRRCGA